MHPGKPQDRYEYRWVAFGSRDPDERGTQIFLVTDDWLNYDAVDWDSGALGNVPGYATPRGAAARGGSGAQQPPRPPGCFLVPERGIVPDNAPWWGVDMPGADWPDHVYDDQGNAPCEEARHNYVPLGAATDAAGVVYGLALREQPGGVFGTVARNIPSLNQAVTLTQDVLRRFQAGIDIPGTGWAGPREADIAQWQAHYERIDWVMTPQNWQWRFGRDPLGEEAVPPADMKKPQPRGHMQLEDPTLEFAARDMPVKCGAVDYL